MGNIQRLDHGHGHHKAPDVGRKKTDSGLSKQVFATPKGDFQELDFTAAALSKTGTPEIARVASKKLHPRSVETTERASTEVSLPTDRAAMKAAILRRLVKSARLASPPYDVQALHAHLKQALENPMIFDHFSQILSPDRQPLINIVFDSKKASAFYDTDKKSIILPTIGTPTDLLDALMFESCNAEFSNEYKTLRDAFYKSWPSTSTAKISHPPMPLEEFGRQMVTIESKSVFKHAQLAYALSQSGFELTEQANRNLISVLNIYLQARGQSVDDTILQKSWTKQSEYLARHRDDLYACFEKRRGGQKLFNQLVLATVNSPHNRNADPSSRMYLNSADLYAYEKLDTFNPGAVAAAMIIELGKWITLDPVEIQDLQKNIAQWIRVYDKMTPPGMRVGMIIDIIDLFAQVIDTRGRHEDKLRFLKSINTKLHLTRQIKRVAMLEKQNALGMMERQNALEMNAAAAEQDRFRQAVGNTLSWAQPDAP